MKSQQSGFTLVEIAIVLVIIGLLLGGILKGQELINSAKAKSLANDFRAIPVYIYGYQDKFRALPGDDAQVTTHLTGANSATAGATLGNGRIDGAWDLDSTNTSAESVLFWQHVRLAGFATGDTTAGGGLPTNADGGRLGVSSTKPIGGDTTFNGTYYLCSRGIRGKFAKMIDTQLDDGKTNSGSVRATVATGGSATSLASTDATWSDDASYDVCMAF
jgi:prepilin-type N-terminal cleavage/methylation domain-containing protein